MPHTRGDVRIYYEQSGHGDPLLLVQGLGYDHLPWTWLRASLEAHFRTIVFDNRGAGRSDKPEGSYTIEELSDDVARLLDHLQIDRASLFGVSLGGYVCQMFALEHPHRLGRLVLGCTYMTGDPDRIQMPASTLELLMTREGTPEQIARRGLSAAFSDSFPSEHPDIFEQLVSWRVENPIPLHGYMGQLNAGLAFDIEDRISHIPACLIIHGDADGVVPIPRAHELHSSIPGSTLHVLPSVGHLFFIERVEETANLILDFIKAG